MIMPNLKFATFADCTDVKNITSPSYSSVVSAPLQSGRYDTFTKIFFLWRLLRKNDNLRILNFAKSLKIKIRENVNMRKLPDLKYYVSAIHLVGSLNSPG